MNFYVLHIAGTVESSVVPADNYLLLQRFNHAVTDAKIENITSIAKVFTNGITGFRCTATQGNGLLHEHIETSASQMEIQIFKQI